MAGNQYRDYIRRSFFRYAFSILSLLFVLVTLCLLINIQWFSVGGNRHNNHKLAQLLDNQVAQYQQALEEFSSDSRILEVFRGENQAANTEANRLLYGFSNSQTIRCTFILADCQGHILCSNLFEGNKEIFLKSPVYQSMTEKLSREPEKILMAPSRLNYSSSQTGDLILGRSVMTEGRILGYLFFDMTDEQLYEAVREYPLDDVILTDRYDNLIFTIGRQSADPMEKYPAGKYRMDWQEGNAVKLNGKHYNVQKTLLPESALILYTLVSIEFQKSLITYGLLFLAAAGLLMVLFLIPITLKITKRHHFAVDELLRSVEEMGKGNMDYTLRSQVFDEFNALNDAFRRMVQQREELLTRNSELSERKRIMEIKQLEEQFNPHFIFNVLETLRYEISIDSAKASDMVLAFASLMRYSIYYGSSIVPLQTDIEYINDYLLLQKMRYNRRLTYHIDIPEELMECRIPKLLLQPVVENSLVHGMKDTPGISVTITASAEGRQLKLCVRDNGSGIEPQKLESLRQGLEQEDVYREHIGLYNSHRVVRLMYGPEYGLSIDSAPGMGTCVTITLPCDMEDEDV